MTTYAPGTIALATVRGVPNVRVMWTTTGNGWVSNRRMPGGDVWHRGDRVTDIRPLVVLDFENPRLAAKVMRQVAEFIRKHHGASVEDSQYADLIADQIEAQTRPPKPAEPTGLGAVVEDVDGVDWHRTRDGRWISADGLRTRAGGWGHIDAVRTLSPGVTA